jgi:hypothetical protein
MKQDFLRNEKGVALVIALIMLIVLTFIGIASISSSVFEARISGNERWGSNAFYAASGGVDVGISQLPDLAQYGPTSVGGGATYWSGRLTDPSPQPQKDLGLTFRPGYDPTFEFRRFQVNATGESFGSRKEIEVQVLMGPYAGGTSYNN